MNIWRLIPFHVPDRKVEFAEWSCRNGTLAIGWGQIGDLRNLPVRNESQIKQLIRSHTDNTANSCSNGGRSLWRFYNEMQIGDLVIISAGSRRQTMRVTGDYYYVNNGDDPSHSYEHRRTAEVVPVNSNRLWQAANGVAPGEGIYSTLVRCDRRLTEEEVDELTG